MSIEKVISNAFSPKSKNGVSKEITEGQAKNIIDRSLQIMNEAKRSNNVRKRTVQRQINRAWEQHERK